MNAENINQVLDALAARFGATGAHLWAVLIRQVYLQAAIDAALGVLTLAVAVWLMRQRERLHEWASEGGYMSDRFMGVGAAYLVFAVCVITAIVSLLSAARALNPEYYALQSVLGGAR